jgi:hypothetical protein
MVQPEPADISNGVRVPAWKRIGLKLANESPSRKRKLVENDNKSSTTETNGAVHDTISSLNKRRKNSNEETTSTPQPTLEFFNSPQTPRQRSNEPPPQVKRKKSVTFTPDTKKEDGDSAQKLYQEWSISQTGSEEEFTAEEAAKFQTTKTHPANAEPPLNPNQSPTIAQAKKNGQTVKKGKSDKREGAPPSESAAGKDPSPTAPYIKYLVQFHSDRDNWKFNKNLQTLLIKHAFEIPSEHHEAFLAYVRGLKGASIRTLLQTAAADVSTQTEDLETFSMEDVNARTEARNQALKRQLQRTKLHLREQQDIAESRTPDFALKWKKRKWSEHIMGALREVAPLESPAEENPAGLPSLAGTRTVFDDNDAPIPKRKKMRQKVCTTGLPDDDIVSISSVGSLSSISTSSEESSDSGSGSDSGSDSDSGSGSDSESDKAADSEVKLGGFSDHSEDRASHLGSDGDSNSDSSDDSSDDKE